MKDTENHKLSDLLHEFMIMLFIGLGIALPVIFISFMDIMTEMSVQLSQMPSSLGSF